DYHTDKKNPRSKKKVWVPVIPEKPFQITLTESQASMLTDFATFQKNVIVECKEAVTNSGVKIKESLEIGTPKIEWTVTIPCFPGFPSESPYILNNKHNYDVWLQALSDLGLHHANLYHEPSECAIKPYPINLRLEPRQLAFWQRTKSGWMRQNMLLLPSWIQMLTPKTSDDQDEMDLDALEMLPPSQVFKFSAPWKYTLMIAEALLVLLTHVAIPLVAPIPLHLPKKITFKIM
ncbi:hypothetical protein VP01_5431g1, partial [Puccinia sorghi]